MKVQAISFTLAELAFGLICSCIFVLPRLYRHMASQPPYKSEEYQLRRYKDLASGAHGMPQSGAFDGVDTSLKREQEHRNAWDHDVEDRVVVPVKTARAGIEHDWQGLQDWLNRGRMPSATFLTGGVNVYCYTHE